MDKIKLAQNIDQPPLEDPPLEEPRWNDEDDFALAVDLLAVSRTKKLKKAQGQAVISGEELALRLRSAYEVQQGLSKRATDWALPKEETKTQGPLAELLKTNTEITHQSPSLKKLGIRSESGAADEHKHKQGKDDGRGVLRTLCFHPSRDIVATGGMDKRLKVLQIEREEATLRAKKMAGVYVKDLPLQSVHFLREGREVVMTGLRKHFYSYDLERNKLIRIGKVKAARETENEKIQKCSVSERGSYMALTFEESDLVAVLCGRTKQTLWRVKVEGGAKSVAFGREEEALFVGSGRGKVFEFEARTLSPVNSWEDEGALEVTALSVSSGHIATGQRSGVVNLYELRRGELVKSFKNLGTEISGVQLERRGRALGFWSRWKKQGIRVASLDEAKVVVPHFPRIEHSLHFPMCGGFSHDGRVLGVGNDEGVLKLFSLSS